MSFTLSTDPYKGTRDFYPRDMAVERFIFDTWSKTAELFGYERYDASILEPSELYKSKGAENEEMVNEQTYTFTDRGGREVTLRPEMTPTVARMIAARHRELTFPVRWYAIPNLFRYERPQRGRLREHWQLNCDLFGIRDISADIEIIALAHGLIMAFGATERMFEIRVNNRELMNRWYSEILGLSSESARMVTRIIDRRSKVSSEEFKLLLTQVTHHADTIIAGLDSTDPTVLGESAVPDVLRGLESLGITNARFDPSIARGFDYYTGTVFELFDTSGTNNRSMIGGGRYDNLTSLFGGTAVPGVGFGMGDVVMRDFLETHHLIPEHIGVTAPTVMVIPTDADLFLNAERIAATFRAYGIRTGVDLSERKVGKKIGSASDAGVTYVLVIGTQEVETQHFTLKNLRSSEERSGTPEELALQA